MALKGIKNLHLQNYLIEHGLQPIKEEYNIAYFRNTNKFYSLLDSYYIEFTCVYGRRI